MDSSSDTASSLFYWKDIFYVWKIGLECDYRVGRSVVGKLVGPMDWIYFTRKYMDRPWGRHLWSPRIMRSHYLPTIFYLIEQE